MFAVLMVFVKVLVAAFDTDRFYGGSYDGYEQLSVTNNAIPMPPPTGTLIRIY